MTYETGKAFKMTEEDRYEEGCIPDTGSCYEVDIQFKADNLTDLLSQIKSYFDVDDEDILLDSCDEIGRLDIQILENDGGFKAHQREIEAWKKGNKRLWSSCYSYQVDKVFRERVKLG